MVPPLQRLKWLMAYGKDIPLLPLSSVSTSTLLQSSGAGDVSPLVYRFSTSCGGKLVGERTQKPLRTNITELQFADDVALVAWVLHEMKLSGLLGFWMR